MNGMGCASAIAGVNFEGEFIFEFYGITIPLSKVNLGKA